MPFEPLRPGIIRFVGTRSILGGGRCGIRGAQEVLLEAIAVYEADEHAYAVNPSPRSGELGRIAAEQGALDEALDTSATRRRSVRPGESGPAQPGT
jgi:hypothetical protein